MKPKFLAALLLCAAVTIVTTVVTATRTFMTRGQKTVHGVSETEVDKNRMTVRRQAKIAKAQGKKKLALPISSGDYIRVNSIEQAAASRLVVIAEPIRVLSKLEHGEDSVGSWYKFKSVEILSEPSYSYSFGNAPAELLPLAENEFVAYFPGGTLEVEGIQVESYSPNEPPLLVSSKYLLFLDFDKASRVARVEFGPDSIFAVHEDGSVRTINKNTGRLQQEMRARFDNSIYRVRAGIKKPASK